MSNTTIEGLQITIREEDQFTPEQTQTLSEIADIFPTPNSLKQFLEIRYEITVHGQRKTIDDFNTAQKQEVFEQIAIALRIRKQQQLSPNKESEQPACNSSSSTDNSTNSSEASK